MGMNDTLGRDYPAESRYYEGEIFELYDHPLVMKGADKKTAQKVAKELRSYGNRARVVKFKNKWWIYWS